MNRIRVFLSALGITKGLGLILLLAFSLRIVGVTYGLPLWLIDDEPPFTLGALQMIQLKTLLPVLHPGAFNVLYYAPYLSYLYLFPFCIILLFKYLFFHGSAALFSSYILSDLSAFFITARVLSVLFGTACVYLIYRISASLFSSTHAGLLAAFLLATSISHIGLSMVARHWMPTIFIFTLTFFILTLPDLEEKKKYIYGALLAGFSAGIDTTALLAVIPIFWWYIFFGKLSLRELVTDKQLWLAAGGFVLLALLPTVLHPGGNGFLHDVTAGTSKSLLGLVQSPFTVFSYALYSEPFLLLCAFVGCGTLLYTNRRLAFFVGAWFLTYLGIFYEVFRLEPRFFIALTPLYALLAGFGIDAFLKRFSVSKKLVLVVLAFPLLIALAFDYRVAMNDTRIQARLYTLAHLTATDRVMVYAPLTRLPGNKASTEELTRIAPDALRKTDTAESMLDIQDRPHALNLYTVASSTFFSALPQYAHKYQYQYFLYGRDIAMGTAESHFGGILDAAEPIVSWTGEDNFSLSHMRYVGNFTELFTNRMLGPTITLYHLP